MKKIFLLFLSASLLSSCSNELDIAADYKETTIVYGLLSLADSVQYVQVFKGYLDESASALIFAQNPDSIFYDDSAEVKLEAGGQVYLLEKIDAAQIGLGRDDGIFVDSPNYVYRLPDALLQDRQYNLTFTNHRTGHIATAQTGIVKDFTINRPSPLLPLNFATPSPNEVQWRSAENGKIYQLVMRFFYEEWNITTPALIDTLSIDWLIFNNLPSSSTAGNEPLSYQFDGTAFLSYLGSQLEVNNALKRRALDEPLEFRFFVGAQDLYDYIRVNGAQTGITSLQVKPEFTNVTNGLGIFSSRYNKTQAGIDVTDRSLDSLSCGRFTRKLNFDNGLNCD